LEDLGETNLQDYIRNAVRPDEIITCYQTIIDLLLKQSVRGAEDFDPAWAYQTTRYSRELILEKECRYFVEAFLNEYLGMDVHFEYYKDEFLVLADNAVAYGVNGFMHRDLQSRNIMIHNNQFYFIDFQGGRQGPIQYDLAALLIDPYVGLPYSVQQQLLEYSARKLAALIDIDSENFRTGYSYCAITRNLQILGAFGFLSRIKQKTYFENYIPTAVKTLKHNLSVLKQTDFSNLKAVVEKL
jgi:aminoglycoside/choline kinase family phosphotransferase